MCFGAIAAGVSKITALFSQAAPWISAAGTAMSAYGSIAQGNAIASAAEYNAKLAEREGEMAAKRGADEERKLRLKAAVIKAKQRAMFGASDVDISKGSPVDVLMATQYNVEQDAATIRYNALNEQLAYGAKAQGFRAEGAAAKTAGKIGAATALFGGLTDFSTKWDTLALNTTKKYSSEYKNLGRSSVGRDQFGRVYIVR